MAAHAHLTIGLHENVAENNHDQFALDCDIHHDFAKSFEEIELYDTDLLLLDCGAFPSLGKTIL